MKRVLSIILATLLIVSVFPLSIFAESSNGFRTNFQLTRLDEKWNTKEDGTGEDYDLLSLDYQLKGEGISGAQGAWIAIDLTKLIVVYYSNGWSILDYISEGIVVPGEPSVEVEDENFYVLKEKVGSGLNVTDQWKFGENSNYFALSEDGNTLYLGTQPTQSKSVTYDLFTTVVSFRLAVRPGAELAGDSVRYINEEERDALNQSFIIIMNDGTNEYSYGDIDGEDDLVIDDFSGDSGISGRPTVHAQAPTFTTIPQNADFYIGDEATLTAAATVEDGGTVSYEWFKNTESSNEGGESVGTGDKLTIPTEAELDAYYYVVATNTNESETINGNKTASTASDAVHVTVSKHPHTIALEEAVAALEAITWEDIAQADANTEDAVRAYLGAIADAAVNNADVVVAIEISDFTAAVAGSAATTHEGTNGSVTFDVIAVIGERYHSLTDQKTNIIATYFSDKLHGEILDEAVAALETITWGDVAQEDANTEDAVRAYLEEIVKTAVGCDDVAVNVSIERFEAAVEGSAATTHEGTDGYAIFTITLSIGEESYTTEVLDVSITATYYSGMTHEEMIDSAVNALDTITWKDIAEEDANTEDTVKAYLEAIADAAVNNAEITIEVKLSEFTAAVAGSAATTHEGTNGAVTFTVSASVGEETYITDEIAVAIIATYFNGKLHSEIIDEAKAALEAIVWEDIAQETANEQDTVAALLKKIAEDAIANEEVEVIILIDTFVPATAGSADTTHEGVDGEAEFFAKAVIGSEIYTLPRQEVAIIATYYSGQLDTEAVADAVTKLEAITWEDIAQETANTEDAVRAYIEEVAKAAVGNDKVTLEVIMLGFEAAVEGSAATTHEGTNGRATFQIKATCGEEYGHAGMDEFDIIATYYSGLLDSEAVEDAVTKLEAITWEDIAQETANTEDTVRAYIEEVAKAAVGNENVTIEVLMLGFWEAVEGSAATTHEGRNGRAVFQLKATCGEMVEFSDSCEFDIIATYYSGQLDTEAVAEAITKLEAITWADIAQETANTEDAVRAYIEEIAKEAVGNDKVTLEVIMLGFDAAVAGSAATTHEGRNGRATFQLKATCGEEFGHTEMDEFDIIATYFDGVLDADAIEEARTKLSAMTWADIAQETANTEDAVHAIIEGIVKDELKNDKLTIVVTISDFKAAVAGSAATTHEGENGYAKFDVTVSLGEESYTLDNQSVNIIATYFDGVLDREAIEEAETKLGAITWADIAEEDGNTEDAVRAIIENIVADTLKNDKLTIKIEITDFKAAVAGSAATTHEGENGYAKFDVTVSLGEESYTLADQSVNIIATYFDGVLDSEAIADAKAKLDAIAWADIAEEDGNTEDAVHAIIEGIVKDELKNDKLTIVVTISDFKAAVAGSAATTHEGENGYAKFDVTVSLGEESYTLSAQEVAIIATYFDGVLDAEAIAEAETKLGAITWADIAEEDGNTEDAVRAIIENIVADTLKNDKLTIKIEITDFKAAVAGSAATTHEGTNGFAKFDVTVSLGEESYTLADQNVNIIATYFDGVLDAEAIEEAETKLEAITWADIAEEDGNTEDAVRAIIEAVVADTLKNDKLTIKVEINDFTAAVAGSAATTHEGENGYAKFDVTVSLGEESYTLADQNVNIIAKRFDGELDKDAIEAVKRLLDGVIWEYISQSEANTEEEVAALLEEIVSEIISNDKAVVDVTIDEFKAAVEGSAATSHDGENGYAKFTVKVTVGSESHSVNEQEVAILATIFEGLLDSEAVEDAFDKTVGGEVVVKIRATEEEIEEAVCDYVRTLLTGDADGVSVSVSLESGSTFKVTLTKGDASAEKIIEMTITEEDPIKLPAPTGLSFNRGIAAWSKVENASGYVVNLYSIKGDTVTLLMTVEADTNKYDFTADIKDNVSYFFDVTAKGDGVFFLDSDASEDSDVYKNQRNDIVDQILADMLAMRNRRFNITAIAGVGGSISDEGVSRVKFGTSKTYTITANEGYEIVSVIVDGRDVGAVSEYKFKDVRAKHTIEVIFEKAETAWENPFTDIYETDTYYEAIEFVYENGLFKGTSETEFEPATTMTRAMFVTVLWRLHGEPVVNYLMQFDDVEADMWYTEAVRWASAEFIVNGYGDGKFGVDDEITVEQAAVILARYAAYTDSYKAADVNLKNYADGEFVSYWAKDQMMWALENEIYESTAGYLKPQSAASRALVAEMLHRYAVKFAK